MRRMRKIFFWGLYLVAFILPLLASSPKVSLYKMIPGTMTQPFALSNGAHEGVAQDLISQTAMNFAVAEWDVANIMVEDTVALVMRVDGVEEERSY